MRQAPYSYSEREIPQRVEELYRRHLQVPEGALVRYYVPGQGYHPPTDPGSQPDRFGICLSTLSGATYQAGDWDVPFPLQSISKVFVYGMALADRGRDQVLHAVGVEPSGDAF